MYEPSISTNPSASLSAGAYRLLHGPLIIPMDIANSPYWLHFFFIAAYRLWSKISTDIRWPQNQRYFKAPTQACLRVAQVFQMNKIHTSEKIAFEPSIDF